MPVARPTGLVLHPMGFIGVFRPEHDDRACSFERFRNLGAEALPARDQAIPPHMISRALKQLDDCPGRFLVISRIADEDVGVPVPFPIDCVRAHAESPPSSVHKRGRSNPKRRGSACHPSPRRTCRSPSAGPIAPLPSPPPPPRH